MSEKRTKNHHFVPRVLQKRFLAEGEKIWFSRRGETGFDEPQLANIEKAFRIRNYYTIMDGDAPSDLVEKQYYSRIDDYLGRLLPMVEKCFASGQIPTFEGAPLDSLRNVVYETIKRTPDFTAAFDEISVGREVIEGTLESLRRKGGYYDEIVELERDLTDERKLFQLGRDVRVRAVVSKHELVLGALEEFSVRWVRCDKRSSFVLSSMMAYRLGNGDVNALANPNMEIWIPIGPKTAVVLLRDPQRRIPLVHKVSQAQVRRINEYAVRNSSAVASHSRELLISLLRVCRPDARAQKTL